jgi:sugar (pentulose or hexulose) kinase
MWLLQECRRVWARQGQAFNWDDLVSMAEQSQAFLAFVNPNAPDFLVPMDMPRAIQQFCRQSGQAVPQTPGQIVRITLESLAFKYREAIEKLSEILGYKPDVLHIIGGGGRNQLLNQFAANVVGLPVIAGPFEAASAGNILMQMIALADLAEGRELIRRLFPTEIYTPQNTEVWNENYRRYLAAL